VCARGAAGRPDCSIRNGIDTFRWLAPVRRRRAIGQLLPVARCVLCREDDRRAQSCLQRALTDNGKKLKGAFTAGCERPGVRITRTNPRHASTTALSNSTKGRSCTSTGVALRGQYFWARCGAPWTRSSSFTVIKRTHREYRRNGLTPATIFWALSQREHAQSLKGSA
jgi:hypothetical protein